MRWDKDLLAVALRLRLPLLWLIGLAGCAGQLARERAAIEDDVRPLGRGHVVYGRVWSGSGASVIEFAFVSDAPRAFGVIAAAVWDGQGRQRIYLDHVTLRGQLDPSSIPKDLKVRVPILAPLEGTEHLVARGTRDERRNLTVANAVWAALDRHQPAEVMAPSTADYRYEDYSAPRALDRSETERLVADFVAAIPDFVIAEKPVPGRKAVPRRQNRQGVAVFKLRRSAKRALRYRRGVAGVRIARPRLAGLSSWPAGQQGARVW